MSRQNLLKSGWFMMKPEEIRVIDSNDGVAQKMNIASDNGMLFAELDAAGQNFEAEQQAVSDDTMARLFGESPSAQEQGESLQESNETAELVQSEMGEETAPEIATQEIAEQILADANAQAEQILENARNLSEQQARQAYDSAKKQGMQDGYQEGFQKAMAEGETLKQELAAKEQQLRETYEEKIDEMEPFLVESLTGIYEHIFEVDLSEHRKVLAHLISNTLHCVENGSSYLIHVSSQDFSYVSMEKTQIIEDGCIGNASLEIVEDVTLSKNECLVETENGIFDCSLSVQLSNLKRKLKLLSYKGKRE